MKICPQNTLSLLSRQIIQQFLDELVWRELWGPIPSQAFDSLVANLAAQTKIDSGTFTKYAHRLRDGFVNYFIRALPS